MFCLSPSPGLPVYITQYLLVCKVFFETFLIFFIAVAFYYLYITLFITCISRFFRIYE